MYLSCWGPTEEEDIYEGFDHPLSDEDSGGEIHYMEFLYEDIYMRVELLQIVLYIDDCSMKYIHHIVFFFFSIAVFNSHNCSATFFM